MSLVKTLAKAAIGIAIAKGVGGAIAGGTAQDAGSSRGHAAGRGTPYGTTNSSPAALGGSDLVDVLGQMLGSRGLRGMGSLGGALEELSQISAGSFSAPSTTHGQPSAFDAPKPGSFGELLDQSLDDYGEPQATPSAQQEEFAAICFEHSFNRPKQTGLSTPVKKSSF